MKQSKINSILVIDDDRDDFELVSDAMQEVDPRISVSFCERCEASAIENFQTYDLVLLDINMPHPDGFVCLKGIRTKGYNNLPIIMFTNSENPSHISRAYKEGANLYFTKPTSYTGLVAGLKKLVNLDWANPLSVTAMYKQKEKYLTFKA